MFCALAFWANTVGAFSAQSILILFMFLDGVVPFATHCAGVFLVLRLRCCVGSWWLAYGGSSKVCPNPRWLTVGLFAFGGPLWSGCLGSVWRRGASPFESPLWPLGFCSGYFSLVFMSARTFPLGPIRPKQELARLTSKTGAPTSCTKIGTRQFLFSGPGSHHVRLPRHVTSCCLV